MVDPGGPGTEGRNFEQMILDNGNCYIHDHPGREVRWKELKAFMREILMKEIQTLPEEGSDEYFQLNCRSLQPTLVQDVQDEVNTLPSVCNTP